MRVVLSAKAAQDLRNATDAYRHDASDEVANEFLREVDDALRFIGRFPDTGSPRYGIALGFEELRHRNLRTYPWLVIDIRGTRRIRVARVLHAHAKIPIHLQER
jgi:toxin ParE1/3/4